MNTKNAEETDVKTAYHRFHQTRVDINKRFGLIVYRIIETKKIKQSEVARTLGMKAQTLSNILLRPEEFNTTPPHLVELCRHFQVRASYLLLGVGDVFSNPSAAKKTQSEEEKEAMLLERLENYKLLSAERAEMISFYKEKIASLEARLAKHEKV